jgi:hypothetical protein
MRDQRVTQKSRSGVVRFLTRKNTPPEYADPRRGYPGGLVYTNTVEGWSRMTGPKYTGSIEG